VRENQDDVINRIVDELKTLPAVPADATARVLARVDAARRAGASPDVDHDDVIYFPTATDEMPAATAEPARPGFASALDERSRRAGGLRRRFMVSLPAAIGYALAATLVGFLIRGALPDGRRSTNAAPTQVAQTAQPTEVAASRLGVTPVASVASREAEEVPIQVQFVLDAPRAKRVAVVGDFNAWDGTSNPLVRDSASGVWSAIVPVTPGRHVYAFLVDDTAWTLDPRAPKTKDADYGTQQSVVIVGMK